MLVLQKAPNGQLLSVAASFTSIIEMYNIKDCLVYSIDYGIWHHMGLFIKGLNFHLSQYSIRPWKGSTCPHASDCKRITWHVSALKFRTYPGASVWLRRCRTPEAPVSGFATGITMTSDGVLGNGFSFSFVCNFTLVFFSSSEARTMKSIVSTNMPAIRPNTPPAACCIHKNSSVKNEIFARSVRIKLQTHHLSLHIYDTISKIHIAPHSSNDDTHQETAF